MFRRWKFALPITLVMLLSGGDINRDYSASEYIPYTQKNIESMVDSSAIYNSMHGFIEGNENIAIAIYDLNTDKLLAHYNANVRMLSASMIKIPIAIAFFDQVSRGKLKYDDKAKSFMDSMITHSKNHEANYLMSCVGGPKETTRLLRKNYPQIFDSIKIVEYIPEERRIEGQSYKNSATAIEYVRMLRELWNDNIPYSDEIKRLMQQTTGNRIRGKGIPSLVTIYNKTGSTAKTCGDIGIISGNDNYGETRSYIFVGIVNKSVRTNHYDSWIVKRGDLLRDISSVVYAEMRSRYVLP